MTQRSFDEMLARCADFAAGAVSDRTRALHMMLGQDVADGLLEARALPGDLAGLVDLHELGGVLSVAQETCRHYYYTKRIA